MARAITKHKREVFLLKEDQDLPFEEQTAFILGPVSYQVQQQVMQLIGMGEAGTPMAVNALIKACLKDVERERPLRGVDGEPIEFEVDKHGVVRDSWLVHLTMPMRSEIAKNRLETFMPNEAEDEMSDVEKSEPSSLTA